MSDIESRRLEAVRCPHCDGVTMPNLLADGSTVCSCTAERALPLNLARGTPRDGAEGVMPAPVDDPGFAPPGPQEHAMPPGEQRAKPGPLPEDKGQFGRDVATEDHQLLRDPPAGPRRGGPG